MLKVLIIEDDPMVAKFNTIYLQSIPGFTVAGHASHVDEGWEFLNKHHVDLILLDVYMGKVTGLEMLIELRKKENPIDVIVITAANDKQSVQTALRYGAVDYLIKPFSFDRFKDALLQYMNKVQLMKNTEIVSQNEIDTFFLNPEKIQFLKLELPKGMTMITFMKIATQMIEREQKKFSAAELAIETGISQVSVRKYLNHLVKHHFLHVDVIYQETGRPLQCYQLNPERKNDLHSFIQN